MINENSKVEFNNYGSWEEYEKKTHQLSRQFKSELLDNLLIIQNSSKANAYLRMLDRRFIRADENLSGYFEIFAGIHEAEFKGLF